MRYGAWDNAQSNLQLVPWDLPNNVCLRPEPLLPKTKIEVFSERLKALSTCSSNTRTNQFDLCQVQKYYQRKICTFRPDRENI